VLEGGEWSAPCPGHFTPKGRYSGTHWLGNWVGPRPGWGAVVKSPIIVPARNWTLSSP